MDSIFRVTNITGYLGGFIDHKSILNLKATCRSADKLSEKVADNHAKTVGVPKGMTIDDWYKCVLCKARDVRKTKIHTNDEKDAYHICDTCYPICIAKCVKCNTERLTYFMSQSDEGDFRCGNGVCDDDDKSIYQPDGFYRGHDGNGDKWTEYITLDRVLAIINGDIIIDQLAIMPYPKKYLVGTRQCDDCGKVRCVGNLVSYQICPIGNKVGVFCADSKCRPYFYNPKTTKSLPFRYDASWR